MADACSVRRSGRRAIVTLPDEVDVSNVIHVRAVLEQALAGGTTVLVADMTRTTFCASEGLHVLIRIHLQAAEAGAQLRLAAPARMIRRVIELTAADQILDLYPSLEAALSPDQAELAPGPATPPPAVIS